MVTRSRSRPITGMTRSVSMEWGGQVLHKLSFTRCPAPHVENSGCFRVLSSKPAEPEPNRSNGKPRQREPGIQQRLTNCLFFILSSRFPVFHFLSACSRRSRSAPNSSPMRKWHGRGRSFRLLLCMAHHGVFMSCARPKTMENKLPSPLPLPAWERVSPLAGKS